MHLSLNLINKKEKLQGIPNQEGEMRNAYLAQNMSDKKFEDTDRDLLTKYLENNTWNISVNQQQLEKDTEAKGCRSTYTYKPVAQKVKPVIQELPSQFRIIRDITGDPLADIPELSPNPPDFEPTGR